jgi:ribose 5-phosphate isomerase B
MKIGVACDHAGFPLKKIVLDAVIECGDLPIDLGTNDETAVDYPDYAEIVGRLIQTGEADRGIIICGSGVGAGIAANKMKGIYAGVCHDTYSAHQGVEHDDMNVLSLGARIIGADLAREIVCAFLQARFSQAERHVIRVEKIRNLETRFH